MSDSDIEKIHDDEERHFVETRQELGELYQLSDSMMGLYNKFLEVAGTAKFRFTVQSHARLHMAQECCYRLSMGTLATLRGHPYDSFRNTREAIEAAAFALRFKEHPHLSRLWRRSVESDERYEKYKNAFGAKKLLPGSSELTRDLKGRYDLCAKLSHPSFLASAHSFKTARAGTRQGLIYPFFHGKKGARGAQRQALLWLLDTHFLTIKLLETALPEVVEKGGPVWQLHVNGVDGSLIHQKSLFKADPDRASSGKRKTEGIILFPAIG